jgi:tetratricopeptide (TPR) repeat protein/serine/threonine protein kinase
MTEQHQSEKSIFLAAIELDSATERAAFLDGACAGDQPLRAELEALLQAHEKQQRLLDNPEAGMPTIDEPQLLERPGTVIGPYKLLQQIGEGGMGTVFMAEQTHPVQRKVALKLIKSGMDSRQVIARFEAERQALALMDHPNIAKVLDAGTTGESEPRPLGSGEAASGQAEPLPYGRGSGRPYFVMELVKGQPITKYCDEHHLTPRQRLELFVPVCQAVQHAHQKGIIHRDLKPSNVMICLYDGKPVPKVIDFGVAKAAGPRLTEHTLFTEFGQVVGTFEYMSPEQAELNQLDIDTRSDIYSLGVLLYELLTGTTPLERKRFKEVAFLEVLRLIREEESPKPSTRLSTTEGLPSIAANRGSEPRKLGGLMRGELDWIAMKALDKDRNRRYETASGFALDILRYLADEAVQACPPSATYRFRKFARRNKRTLATAALLGVILLGAVGVVAGSMGWVARDRAARQLVVNEIAARALDEADEKQEQGQWPEALAAVKRAEAALAGGGSEDLKRTTRERREDLEMVERLEGIRLQERPAKDVFFDSARTDGEYASAFHEYGFDVESLPAAEAANRLGARGIRAVLASALDDWAIYRRGMPESVGTNWKHLLAVARIVDSDAFRNRLRDALEQQDRNALVKLASEHNVNALPARSLLLLGDALARLGAVAEGVALLTKAQQKLPGDFWINIDLAFHLDATADRPRRAVEYYRAALAVRPQNASVHSSLGIALYNKGLLDEAIAAFKEAIRLKPDYALAHNNLGNALRDKGLLDEAIAAFNEAIRLKPDYALAHNNLGNALRDKGLLNEGFAELKTAIRLQPNLALAHASLGNALRDKALLDEAIAACREAIRLEPDLAWAHDRLGGVLGDKGLLDEAIAAHREAIRLEPDNAEFHHNLGVALTGKGLLDEAVAACREAIRLKPDLAVAHALLGVALQDKGQLDEAIAAHQKAIALKPDYGLAHYNLGNALVEKGKLDDAIACYRKAIRLKPDDVKAHYNLGLALQQKGAVGEAIACYKEAIRLKPDLAMAHNNLGVALHDKGLLDEAIAAHREAIRLKLNDADAHTNLGTALHHKGLLDEAIAAHREAIRLKPDLAMAHNNLGNALAGKGKVDEAIASLKEAIRLKPDYAEAHNNLGGALGKKCDLVGAIAEFQKAIALKPDYAEPHSNLGIVLEKKGDVPGAIAAYQKAIALKPDFAGAHNNLAWLLANRSDAKSRDPVGAVKVAEKAVELAPQDGANWNTLGAAHYRAGHWKAAVTALEKSRELRKGGDSFDWFFLAMAHWRLGDKEQARKWYDQAVQWMEKNKPQDEELHRFRAEAAELLQLAEPPKEENVPKKEEKKSPSKK